MKKLALIFLTALGFVQVASASFTVTNTNDGGAGSLRQAVLDANSNPGTDVIVFDSTFSSTQHTINLTTAELAISDSVTIQGPGPNLLTVQRAYNAATNFRVFNIPSGGLTVSISGMTISNGNSVGAPGGGINCQSNLLLTNVHVTGNQASVGGGVALDFAGGTFASCTFSGNIASSQGGGIEFESDGGRTLALTNSTVSGNTANGSGAGGGIFHGSGSGHGFLVAFNCTIANNSGANGGGIHTVAGGSAANQAATLLNNTIIANNTPTNLVKANFSGATAGVGSQGFNLSDNYNGAVTLVSTDLTGQPLLGPLSFNGGTTPTHALLGGSPALDKGNATGTDQRGQARQFNITTISPASGGNDSDIGAVEMQALIVNSTADPGDGVCDATCTLRDAITAANANGPGLDDIIFDNTVFSTSQTISLLSVLPNITSTVTLNGLGANLLTVRRDFNAATDFRIFNIAGGITNGVNIAAMTISNGRGVDSGGGINSLSNLTLTNVHVTGNQATGGGAVGVTSASGVFTGCTFSGNTAGFGGAINYQGGDGFSLRLINSTVSGNSATTAGGGIFNVSLNNSSRLEVTSSTIVNNSTGIQGGGIDTFVQGNATLTATTTLRNSLIAGNSPDNLFRGGNGGGAPTFTTLGFNLSDDYNGAFTLAGTDKTGQPLLGPLSLNGGTVPTRALLGGSPALDAGDASGLTTDQRGQPRVFGSTADIGAVEMRPLIVTNTTDSLGAGTFRQAITDANANAGLDDIIFAVPPFGTAHTITLSSALPDITSDLTINGPGANLLTIQRDPNVAANFRIFNIVGGLANGVAITGVTISNGRALGSMPVLDGFGGGVQSQSRLTLTNVYVTGNQSNLAGGGVALEFADGVFNGCTFAGNSANAGNASGGGIFFQGDGGRTLRVVSGTVSGNHTPGNIGGGIVNLSGGGTNSRLEIINSTIANNSAASFGGILTLTQGVANSTATTLLRNTIVADNSPDNLSHSASTGAATVTTLGFNLASDNGGGFLNVAPVTTDKINASAGLAPLGDNGGTTPTRALFGTSAALEAGNNSGSGTLFDQRGGNFLRTVDLPAANATNSDGTDIGAFEAQSPPLGLVANVSTRLPVGTGDGALIQGFIVLGPNGSTKKIIVRALGPSLIPFGISDAVANPTLEIFNASNTKIASNDDWKTTQLGGIIPGDQFGEINGSGVAPSKDFESAIIANLSPGAYTAVVRGAGNSVGTGVVDAFDLSAGSAARLANIATRGLIQPGDKLMIAGFIVESAPVKVVVRALGPSLAQFGITNALSDTTLELHDQNGSIVRQNDNWMTDQKTELENTGLQPSNNLEAALVDTIPPGLYTAQVRGKPETTGTGVVEIYFLQ